MCGIFGIVSLDGSPVDASRLNVAALRDRGPDNVGQARFDRVALIHTRLAVIDRKEMSNQPIRGDRLAVVCNGEIFNHQELRDGRSYRYATPSDCEAVLDVYSNDGIPGFARLDGFFSFGLVDESRGEVILHRDNVGKKPLFWTSDGRRLLFASNVTALVDNLSKVPDLDREQIPFLLQNGFVDPRASLFRGIHPLLPGEVLQVDLARGHVRKSRLTKPCTRLEGLDWNDESLLQSTFEHHLRVACEKRVRGLEAPVLILSGGLDSTVLAHELVAVSSGTKLVTLKQPLRWLNDEPYARAAARRLGRPLLFAHTPSRVFATLRGLLRKLDQPITMPSYAFLSLLAVEARRFGNVLFTGDGADEVLFGYRDFDAWVASTDDAARTGTLETGPPFGFALSEYGHRQGVIDLVGHAFVKVDKATAENQMEARCPFLDWDLLAFIRQIPVGYWRRHGTEHKWPLRRYLLSRGVPESHVRRRKIGFAFPLRYLLAPSLGTVNRCIRARADLLRDVGITVPRAERPWTSFREFHRTWTNFVLAEYLARVLDRAPAHDWERLPCA